MNVHRAVIENEESESGCTVHLVTEEYDQGPILAQTRVPVKKSDDAKSLAQRILSRRASAVSRCYCSTRRPINPKRQLLTVSLQPLSELPEDPIKN
ncbi:MAG: formyltransferase family protein [Fodinibius sp.]|nr:formyltransferase family protein [Fodinibius sp.]